MRKRIALGAAIKAIRTAKAAIDPDKFAGSKFSVACLVSHGTLCNIEAGRRQPSEELIHRIAALLGEPVEAISYLIDVPMEAAA